MSGSNLTPSLGSSTRGALVKKWKKKSYNNEVVLLLTHKLKSSGFMDTLAEFTHKSTATTIVNFKVRKSISMVKLNQYSV
jgi:hypothetical protein